MRRFWLPEGAKQESQFVIEGDSFKHICGVCRMEEGAHFEIIIGDGMAYFVELKDVAKKVAIALIKEQRELPKIPQPYIHLYLSMPKMAKFEWIVEKAVELGVKSITPVFSDFSFTKKKSLLVEKQKRLQKIIEGACQQSARAEKLELNQGIDFDAMLNQINQNPSTVGLFAYEGESKLGLKQALKAESYHNASEIALLVGSEGGFSQEELEKCIENKLDPVSLGPQVLRVETACVTLISVIKYEMELFDWT